MVAVLTNIGDYDPITLAKIARKLDKFVTINIDRTMKTMYAKLGKGFWFDVLLYDKDSNYRAETIKRFYNWRYK